VQALHKNHHIAAHESRESSEKPRRANNFLSFDISWSDRVTPDAGDEFEMFELRSPQKAKRDLKLLETENHNCLRLALRAPRDEERAVFQIEFPVIKLITSTQKEKKLARE
jgi:hypothetical protein